MGCPWSHSKSHLAAETCALGYLVVKHGTHSAVTWCVPSLYKTHAAENGTGVKARRL